ncbi:LysR family transcriptional regulator [Sulfidibacter corallicola]|uniref:LysR family transcriptional regulator n=1 Tax=Sulfidibacter corallicola TaxID=2818388 RepID=A0A8A4TM26_SULCO|nr:LysR substrate-binding domain-containing protein [Sulfidibacter corallicola]QTD50620.1 LysR family transcriptional regulator [Sulfidibacter corallicola]
MRDLPLNAIRAFAAVYELGGIRPAARYLQVTHSSVSRHVRELESWLGRPLLVKGPSHRVIAFTPEGESLGRASLEGLRELAQTVAGLRESKPANAVTVSTVPSFAIRWLLPRLPDFEAQFPGIELSIVTDQRPVDPSEQGADFCIRMGRGPWPSLDCTPLMDDWLVPVMSKTLWEEKGHPQSAEAFANLPLLHDRDPSTTWESWRSIVAMDGVDLQRGPRFTSSDLVLRAAVQGLGVALARARLAADEIAAQTLVQPFDELRLHLPNAYWIALPEGVTPRLAVKAVIDWLRDQASRQPTAIPTDARPAPDPQ